MTIHRSAIGLVVGAALLAGACFHEEQPAPPPAYPQPPPMLPASGAVLSTSQAANVLSAATCDREARCNGIGPGVRYPTYDECRRVNYDAAMRNFQACPYGVKDRELAACRSEIETHACGGLLSPLEWFQRSITCRTTNICLR